MADSWIVGRKELRSYLRVSWDTIRKWRREYGCPIRVLPGGKPAALSWELDRWMVLYSKKKQK